MSLITPQEVIDYTESPRIKKRAVSKLELDIIMAENKVFDIVGHDFSDTEKYPQLPDKAKIALLMWAEYYALKAIKRPTEGMKSEQLDEYSYTKYAELPEPDTYDLLKEFIEDDGESAGKRINLSFKVI